MFGKMTPNNAETLQLTKAEWRIYASVNKTTVGSDTGS